jgi:hypothetical protein
MSRPLPLYSDFFFFWEKQTECLIDITDDQQRLKDLGFCIPAPHPNKLDNDSDSDLGDSGSSKSGAGAFSLSSSSSTGSVDEAVEGIVTLGDTWEKDCDFQSTDPNPKQLFEEHFTATSQSRRNLMGLQCTSIQVSTPIRA